LEVNKIDRKLGGFDASIPSTYFPGDVSNCPVFSEVKNERSRVVSRVMVIDVPLTGDVTPHGHGRKDELAKGFFYGAG
jgi:hypothetical protein